MKIIQVQYIINSLMIDTIISFECYVLQIELYDIITINHFQYPQKILKFTVRKVVYSGFIY